MSVNSGHPAPQGPPWPPPQALPGPGAMRASHADRERTTDVLKAGFAEGRLNAEEYGERVERVHKAQTYGELSAIVQDLPNGPMPMPYLPQSPYLPAAFAPQPYAQPGPYRSGPPYPYQYPPFYGAPAFPPPVRRTNGTAVAALVLGIAEFWTLGLTAVPALICGHTARAQIRRQGGEGSGMATAGIVLGWLAVGFWGLVLLLAVLAAGH